LANDALGRHTPDWVLASGTFSVTLKFVEDVSAYFSLCFSLTIKLRVMLIPLSLMGAAGIGVFL